MAAGNGTVTLGPGKDVCIHAIKIGGSTPLIRIAGAWWHLGRKNAQWPAGQRVDVANMSYGMSEVDAALRERAAKGLKAFAESGGIVVLAAGNDNADSSNCFPQGLVPQRSQKRTADDPFALFIGVGASSVSGERGTGTEVRSEYSNTGSRITLVAPSSRGNAGGTMLVAPRHDLVLDFATGTSMSAPIVAGLAAQMIYFDRGVGHEHGGGDRELALKVVEILEATADDIGLPADQQGFGRVNAWKAMLAIANKGIPTGDGERFTTLDKDIVDHKTEWYGFQIVSQVHNATVWLKIGDAAPVKLREPQAKLPKWKPPAEQDDIVTYKGVQQGDGAKVPRGCHVDANGQATNGFFYTTFSVKRENLGTNLGDGDPATDQFNGKLELRKPGDGADIDAFCSLDLNLPQLRHGEATSSNGKVVRFDNFVFYIDATP